MAGEELPRETDHSVAGMALRLDVAAKRLKCVATRVANDAAWDDQWLDTLENPPQKKSYGAAIAHVITHSMHHRAQLLYMLRQTGVKNLPEGDIFSWESAADRESKEQTEE